MATSLRDRVWERAAHRCEYCHMPQECTLLPHAIDHIRPQKHRGRTTFQNLCLACAPCNWHKGSNPVGYDPQTDRVTLLYDPRSDTWADHFTWDGPLLVGKTPTGRTTVDVLRINAPDRVEHRRLLVDAGAIARD